jgi:hypothetical protein
MNPAGVVSAQDEMNRVSGQRNPVATALYINAALVAVLILVLLARPGGPALLPAALAQNQANIAGGAGIYVMPGQFSTNAWGCYLLDVDQQTLCLYQYMPGEKNLRLVSARNFQYDRRLRNYNTEPDPQNIRELIEKEANPPRRMNDEQAPVSPEG